MRKHAVPPQIPQEEFIERWKRVQEFMGHSNIDLLFAYGDDRAVFGAAHVRWLADVPVHFEPLCMLMPREGEPVLLSGPESDQYAILRGKIKNVRVLREFTHPDEDYPYSVIYGLAEIIADLGLHPDRIKRVGIGGRYLISADVLSSFQHALPNAEWLDLESQLCELRAIKSPAEIAVIRFAYKIAEQGIQAAIDKINPGVSEREVAAEAEAVMRHAGAEGTGIDTIVASGPNSRPILARPTFREIEENDLVLLTVAPRFEGYHGAIGRLVVVGEPNPEIGKALEIAVRAQQACYRALRPDVEGRDVEKVGRAVVEKAGLGQYFLYSGLHSVGVIEFEPPIFGPSSPAKLQENMIISVDIPLFNTPWGGLRVEDGYLITAEGAERLSHTDYVSSK
ncbi:MAG TPA: aminopeptidase P family protein [Anaerolineae bacterium]|nr:aminopeptidase P family protein [Anaerolineae bacterium]